MFLDFVLSHYLTAGVDELAPGSTFATTGGGAAASFAGAFNPATAAFEGDYEVVLAGRMRDWPEQRASDDLGTTAFTVTAPR